MKQPQPIDNNADGVDDVRRQTDMLIARFAGGDARAFDEIVAMYYDEIARLVHRLSGWQSDTDDILHEVFLIAMRKLPKFRGRSSLSTWLGRIAMNLCRARHRRHMLWDRWFGNQRHTGKTETETTGETTAIEQERAARVREAIRELGPSDREVIVLHYLEQWDIDRIATTLNVRRNTVEVRLHRAKKRLALLLDDIAEDYHVEFET